MRDILTDLFRQQKIKVEKKQIDKLLHFYDLIVEGNKMCNLTRITSEEETAEKHFLDSAMLLEHMQGGKLLDVGSGAGFPGIVIAILSDVEVTLVETANKKASFLKCAGKELGLDNVRVIKSRIEDFKDKGSFDYATARAVANLAVISEYTLPFLKVGGTFLAQKGPKYIEELDAGNKVIEKLGGKIQKISESTLPLTKSERFLLVVEKVEETDDKFPRNPAKIQKESIV